jgi:hypothetical protein
MSHSLKHFDIYSNYEESKERKHYPQVQLFLHKLSLRYC